MTESYVPSALALAALAYARMGLRVFPLHGVVDGRCTCGRGPEQHLKGRKPGKHPATKDGFKAATSDLGQVAAWWRKNPHYNIGLATGEGSGCWVLDVDGPDGAKALAALEAVNGALPETAEQATGGGRHMLFLLEPGRQVRNRSRLGKSPIDVRGEGGYIVAPPSVHMSGRVYAWTRPPAPGAIALPPAWLLQLVLPAEPVASPIVAPKRRDGRASKYGEAVLDSACRRILQARVGSRDTTLYQAACSVGCYVAGGELDHGYARDALVAVGRTHVPDAMTEAGLQRQVDRGLDYGAAHPRSAPERERARPAVRREEARTPVESAIDMTDARALWASAGSADKPAVRTWFRVRGLDLEALPGALRILRAHAAAPFGDGRFGPALLAPLVAMGESQFGAAIAVLPLIPPAERFTHFVGDPAGRAAVLCWPVGCDQAVVALDLQDGWALGQAAFDSDDPMAVIVTPTLRAFAGAPLGDRFGRINEATPRLDPAQPPWTRPGLKRVYLAMRGDLRTPELKVRGALGGTTRRTLEGAAAARFLGGLAAQGWHTALGAAAGANPVHLLQPSDGRAGFNFKPCGVA